MKNKGKILFLLFCILPFVLTACRKKTGIGSKDLFNTYYGLTRSEVREIAPQFEIMSDSWVKIDEKKGFELDICFSDYGRVFGVAMSYDPRVKNKYQAHELMDIPSYAHCYNENMTTIESYVCFRDF